jgi:3-oxoacyl-[acyl-carrier protein] reductase
MDLGLTGKSVLVTAASRGIGKATARTFLEEGARVTICGRDQSSLDAALEDLRLVGGDRVHACSADVSIPEQQVELCRSARQRFGTIDVLINNAGGPPPGTHDTLSDQDWQSAFDLTLRSAVRMTNLVLPDMQADGWGRIINISSYSVKQPIDRMMLSNSLRLGVLGWAKTLSNEVAAQGILVNTVCPGWTDTDRVTALLEQQVNESGGSTERLKENIGSTIPIGRIAVPQEIASVIVFLASEAASYITGTAVAVDGGASRTL